MKLSVGRLEWVVARLALVGSLALLLGACESSIDPASTGGKVIAGTEGIDCGDHQPMSYSPDGRWLAFWLWTNRGENAPREHQLALLDLETGARHLPAPEAFGESSNAETVTPRIDTLCWSLDGQRLLTGVLPPDTDDNAFTQQATVSARVALHGQRRSAVVHAIDLDQPDRMEGADASACRAGDIGHWRFHNTHSDDWTRLGKAQVERVGPRLIRLMLTDGRVLGEHRPVRISTRSLMVSDHAWSPNRTQLAYVVHELRGSWGGLSHAWLASVDGEPEQLLSGPVYAMKWRNDQELHMCLRRPGQAESAVFSWSRLPVSSR